MVDRGARPELSRLAEYPPPSRSLLSGVEQRPF